ncbi:MAG TPA: dihydroorotase [Candidatus Andersenbacteria bacterium]|nr:dihydroorotase [Candidatus Andersenbacteria bacterium]
MKQITLPFAFDAHVHLRDGEMLQVVAPLTAKYFSGAIVMPNLIPAVRTLDHAREYRKRIMSTIEQKTLFDPLMTFKIYPDTTLTTIGNFIDGKTLRPIVVAGKVYPKGLTTNAQDGVEDYSALFPLFATMEELKLVLCLHGEKPGNGIEGMDREERFLRTLFFIARTFPRLKIVMEHITTEAAVDAILQLPENVAATITAHHLVITHDDVGGDRMRPHNFCKPVAKRASDRAALIEAAISGCPKFFFGSDSAPHPRDKKECSECCAGVFTAPIALPLLAQIFDKHNALDRLASFVGNFAETFYGAHRIEKPVNLVQESMIVPQEYCGIVPFLAGEELSWRIRD